MYGPHRFARLDLSLIYVYNRGMKTLEAHTSTEQEPEVLDAATLAAVDRAQRSFEAGDGITVKDARELNRRRYQVWLNAPHGLTA
jgi:hypothetical protein